MTIPLRDYCPNCEQISGEHPRICTICGETLTEPPDPPGTQATIDLSPVPQYLRDEVRAAGTDMRDLLHSLQREIEQTHGVQLDLMRTLQDMRAQWQTIPPELLNPQSQASGRPVSRKYLQSLPVSVLEKKSALLQQARLILENGHEIEAIPGEFGQVPDGRSILRDAVVLLVEPRTARGGLSSETQRRLAQESRPVVCVMDRGGDVTFAVKARVAQEAGASAAVVVNHVSSPWPYIMKDSRGEGTGLEIPTVMVAMKDRDMLIDGKGCRLEIERQAPACIICTDEFVVGSTVVRVPECGHLYHHECIRQWWESHNTCPYCRRELPTDDEDYEQERRRAGRTHGGASAPSDRNSTSYDDFYT